MCLIVVKPKNADYPKKQHLINGDSYNSDGIGVAYCKANKQEVYIKKDFQNINTFLEWMYANIQKEDILVIHFRWATSGLKDMGNRHPFPITDNKELLRQTEVICQYAVAHNGILTEYSGHNTFSDTQKFVVDILNDSAIKNNLESEAVRKLIGNFIGRDKLVILSKDSSVYLFGEFEKEEDIYFSNGSYNYRTNRTDLNGLYNGVYQGKFRINDVAWQDQKNQRHYIINCDGCGEHKLCREVGIVLLCKSCRKKYRKGKLKHLLLPDDPQPIEDEAMEENEGFSQKCPNCSEWYNSKFMKQYYATELCSTCYNSITQKTLEN